MPKTVQIRDIDDDTYNELARRAADDGISVPELLRRLAVRAISRPSLNEWLERTRRRSSDIETDRILETLDELRGPWPNADR